MNIPVKQSIACTVLSLAVAHGADSSAPREVARPLPLAAVRLTDAPLKQAQDLDAAYPLSLELDRLLAGYWLRAGLEPRAKGYGGSDSVEGKQLAGHITGHYLSVVSLMCAATGDGRFKERADQLALRFKEVQDKPGTSFEATDGNEIAAVSGIRMIRAGEQPAIRRIDPPEQGFFSKRLDYHGIPIKAHKTVSDEALREAYQ
nr:glycoside hydrolase family 127 protein [Akkermansiaceae bacterium]